MRSAMIGVAALLAGGVLLVCIGCSGEETPEPKETTGTAASSSDEGGGGLAPEVQKLIGLWKGKMPSEVGIEKPDMSVEFKDDGTLNIDARHKLSGTWELVKAEEDKLIVNSVLGMEMPSIEGEAAEAVEEIEVESEKEEMEFTILFETEDRITMTFTDVPDEPFTLERQP